MDWPTFEIPHRLADGRSWTASFDSYDEYRDCCYYLVVIVDGGDPVDELMARVGLDPEPMNDPALEAGIRAQIADVAASGRSNTAYRGYARKVEREVLHLVPRPRRIVRRAGTWRQGPVDLILDPALPAQGYRLHVRRDRTTIVAADPAGRFYGQQTLAQLVENGQAPCVDVEDHPDIAVRGVMLDVSRDKVPTMATLLSLIDLLASWKINQLQLYVEHTFAYAAHRDVWRDASPLTAAEIRELDAYCRERFIELVPNQNSFGHLERWFMHERYRPLAETPGGVELPWGEITKHPFTLAPSPDALAFLDGLYTELLPNFTSDRFNVGCDETYDLGLGRSRDRVEREGRPRVWLDFVRDIRALAALWPRRNRHGGMTDSAAKLAASRALLRG